MNNLGENPFTFISIEPYVDTDLRVLKWKLVYCTTSIAEWDHPPSIREVITVITNWLN